MRFLRCIIAAVTLSAVVAGAVSPADRLGTGDTVRVTVTQEADLSVERTVDDRGGFQYPLLGYVNATDRSPAELAQHIADRLLREGFLRAPEVKLTLISSPRNALTIDGAIAEPTQIEMEKPLRLNALLKSLKLTSKAGPRLLLYRPSSDTELVIQRQHLDPKAAASAILNVTLERGDRIFIESLASISLVSTKAVQPVSIGKGGSTELSDALGKVRTTSLFKDAQIAIVDRIGTRTEVWYVDAARVLDGDPRAQRTLWPGNLCFILPPGGLGIVPHEGRPSIVETGNGWTGEALRGHLSKPTTANAESASVNLRWYPGDTDIPWWEIDAKDEGIDRGVVIERPPAGEEVKTGRS